MTRPDPNSLLQTLIPFFMRFVETPVFTAAVRRQLDDESYRALHGRPTQDVRQARSEGILMKDTAFQELLTSIRQAGRIRRGTLKPARVTTFRPADVKSIREKLKASQAEFALMIGVSVATLRNWEQGRRRPDGPALALLRVAARNPHAVAEALHRQPKKGAA